MSLLPSNQRDQVKVLIGFAAAALAVAYYVYPYASKEKAIAAEVERVEQLQDANRVAAREFASGSIDQLRAQTAENRSALTVMRRLVPTGNEVPALLDEPFTRHRPSADEDDRRAGAVVGVVDRRSVARDQRRHVSAPVPEERRASASPSSAPARWRRWSG